MKNENILRMLLFFALFVISVSGCFQKVKELPIAEKTEEEVTDSGVLVIESSPSSAQVYVNGEFKGKTPIDLYNTFVGDYNIIIKKEGYIDFEKTVIVKVGRTEEVYVKLTQVAIKPEAEEKKLEEPTEKMPESVSAPSKLNKINLSSFVMYYDFDKMEFTEIRTAESDLFSRKYDTYVYFTALTPTKINVINKPVSEVSKEDCIFADTAVVSLFSGQTLCVKTGTGNVVAIGGIWQISPAELELVQFG